MPSLLRGEEVAVLQFLPYKVEASTHVPSKTNLYAARQ